ncbi:hypothetical protein P692DRAFT_20882252 [Suillus brevipes Sb2]|nr:hypothetical protein P692DRAFT_20882252 [Suillus brevipes Sb2]
MRDRQNWIRPEQAEVLRAAAALKKSKAANRKTQAVKHTRSRAYSTCAHPPSPALSDQDAEGKDDATEEQLPIAPAAQQVVDVDVSATEQIDVDVPEIGQYPGTHPTHLGPTVSAGLSNIREYTPPTWAQLCLPGSHTKVNTQVHTPPTWAHNITVLYYVFGPDVSTEIFITHCMAGPAICTG